MNIIGSQRKFHYPFAFTSLPEYSAHAGQIVMVVRRLTDDEADQEHQPMYLVRADDGWEGHAFDDELVDVVATGR